MRSLDDKTAGEDKTSISSSAGCSSPLPSSTLIAGFVGICSLAAFGALLRWGIFAGHEIVGCRFVVGEGVAFGI